MSWEGCFAAGSAEKVRVGRVSAPSPGLALRGLSVPGRRWGGGGGQRLQRLHTDRWKPQGERPGAREGDFALAQPLPPSQPGSARPGAPATRMLTPTGGFPPARAGHFPVLCRACPSELRP